MVLHLLRNITRIYCSWQFSLQCLSDENQINPITTEFQQFSAISLNITNEHLFFIRDEFATSCILFYFLKYVYFFSFLSLSLSLSLSLYIYIYMYVCVCVCMYVYVYVYMCMCMYICVIVCMYACVYVCMCVCACVCACVRVRMLVILFIVQ